jgi:hypothetical protein
LAISGEGGTEPVLAHEEARCALLADSVGELGASGVIALAEELGVQREATSAGGASCGSLREAVGVAALAVLQLEAEVAGEADTGLEVVARAENGHLHAGSSRQVVSVDTGEADGGVGGVVALAVGRG